MKKSFIIVSLISLSFIIILPLSTFAQDRPSEGVENRQELIDKAKEENTNFQRDPQDGKNYRCSTTSSRIDLVNQKYRRNFERHMNIYRNIVGRVNELLDDVEAEGYDVSAAREANERFRQQVEALNGDFLSYESEMDLAKKRLCEDDVTGFRESLEQSRNQLKVIRNNMIQVRNMFQEEVKPELIKLREEMAKESNE